ncbi:hypothetical protein D3C76_387180 [compost metagenome]
MVGCSSNNERLDNDLAEDIQNEARITQSLHNEEVEDQEVQKQEVQNHAQNEEIYDKSEKIGYIDMDDLWLNDLYLKMPYIDLLNIMGTEQEKIIDSDLGDNEIMYRLLYADGTIIHLIEEEIYSVEVISRDYQTPRGLRVGDTKEKVIELYNYPAYKEDSNWGYSTTNDYILFTVEFHDIKVSKIGINLVM